MTNSTNSLPLQDKIALITGASKGIGAAAALHLSSLGARIAIIYSSDPTPIPSLIQQLGGPDRAIAIKADASKISEIERFVKEVVEKWGKIDILIANAGVAINHDLMSTTEEEWERTFAVNVKGPYFLVQKAAQYIPSGGRIILLSTSLCASSPITPNYLLYVSSKGAIEQMIRVLAKDLGRRGITVNGIAPGPTGTDLFFQGKSEELVKQIASTNPFQRLGTPGEIAGAMGMLVSEGGSWVNGQVLRVNGGMTVG